MSRSDAGLKAPRHLTAATRRWFNEVLTHWELEPHNVRLLQLAAESWDRCQQARALVAKEGLTTGTREGNHKLHPAVRVESDARLAFARLLRELDLDLDPPAETKRPPMLRSMRPGSAA